MAKTILKTREVLASWSDKSQNSPYNDDAPSLPHPIADETQFLFDEINELRYHIRIMKGLAASAASGAATPPSGSGSGTWNSALINNYASIAGSENRLTNLFTPAVGGNARTPSNVAGTENAIIDKTRIDFTVNKIGSSDVTAGGITINNLTISGSALNIDSGTTVTIGSSPNIVGDRITLRSGTSSSGQIIKTTTDFQITAGLSPTIIGADLGTNSNAWRNLVLSGNGEVSGNFIVHGDLQVSGSSAGTYDEYVQGDIIMTSGGHSLQSSGSDLSLNSAAAYNMLLTATSSGSGSGGIIALTAGTSGYIRLNGKVRIGDTNAPTYQLDVVGDIYSSNNLRASNAVVASKYQYNAGTDIITISTSEITANQPIAPSGNGQLSVGTSSKHFLSGFIDNISSTSIIVGGNSVLTTVNVNGTAGQIPKFTGSNTVGNTTFLWENSTYGLGIGHAGSGTIAARLDIVDGSTNPEISIRDYQNSSDGPKIYSKTSRGTSGSPLATSSDDLILGIRGFASSGAGGFPASNNVSINFFAAENQTATAAGSYIAFYTTATGSAATAVGERARIDSTGHFLLGTTTTTPSGLLHVNGDIFANQKVFTSGVSSIPQGTSLNLFSDHNVNLSNSTATYVSVDLSHSSYGLVGINEGSPTRSLHVVDRTSGGAIWIESNETTSYGASILGASYGGTYGSKTATSNGDILTSWQAFGSSGTTFAGNPTGVMKFVASEDNTGTAGGTIFNIELARTGSRLREGVLDITDGDYYFLMPNTPVSAGNTTGKGATLRLDYQFWTGAGTGVGEASIYPEAIAVGATASGRLNFKFDNVSMYIDSLGYAFIASGLGIGRARTYGTLDVSGSIHIGANANATDLLNTVAATGLAISDLYWGSKKVLTEANIASFGVSSLTCNSPISGNANIGAVTIALNFNAANTWVGTQTFGSGTSGGIAIATGVVAAGKLLRTDSSGNIQAVTIGSNIGWDGTTLSAVGSLTPSGTAGGDLSGSYPNPTVAKVNGVSVTGSASVNKAIVAESASVASWQNIVNSLVTGSGISITAATGQNIGISINPATSITWTSGQIINVSGYALALQSNSVDKIKFNTSGVAIEFGSPADIKILSGAAGRLDISGSTGLNISNGALLVGGTSVISSSRIMNSITFGMDLVATASTYNIGSPTTFWNNGYITNLSGSTGVFTSSLTVAGSNVLTNNNGAVSAGQIAFFSATNSLSGSNNLFFDRTSGYVGIRNNTPTSPLAIKGDSGTDGPALGTEFITATGWTSGGWTGNSTIGWTHTTGNVSALSFNTSPTVGGVYYLTVTMSSRTSGSVNVDFGGVRAYSTATGTVISGPLVATTGYLTITPTSDFNGTVVLSAKPITGPSNPIQYFMDSAGSSNLEIRVPINSPSFYTTLIGASAGQYNFGDSNTALGSIALRYNTAGRANTAIGRSALSGNNIGSYNVAVGYYAGAGNVYGTSNTIVGTYALSSGASGNYNTVVGDHALSSVTSPSGNTALGYYAGQYLADGSTANTSATGGIYIGDAAKANADNGNNETVIGTLAIGSGSNTIVLGNTSVSGTYLRGAVGINLTAAATHLLELPAGTTAASGISLGNDALIYRNGTSGLQIGAANGITFTGDLLASSTGRSIGSAGTYWSSGFISNLSGSSISGNTSIFATSITSTSGLLQNLTPTGGNNTGVVGTSTAAYLSGFIKNLSGDAATFATSVTINGNAAITTSNVNGSAGKIAYFTGTNSVTNGTSLYWDNTNTRLGVGVSVPGYAIDTSGSLNLTYTTHSNPHGLIYKGGVSFLHDFNYGNNGTVTTIGANLFLGTAAGNLTMGSGATQTYHGSYNVGLGYYVLNANNNGFENIGIGYQALRNNTDGYNNVAVGHAAGTSGTTGTYNVYLGGFAGYSNTSGNYNVGIGHLALYSNTSGEHTAVGYQAMQYITSGYRDVALGYEAGIFIADGVTHNTLSTNSTYIGYGVRAGADGNTNEVVIGYAAIASGSNSVVLGNTSIATTYLRGAVGIGVTAAPTHSLEFIAATSSLSGISFGNDVLAYRNGTSGLQIDSANGITFTGNLLASAATKNLGSAATPWLSGFIQNLSPSGNNTGVVGTSATSYLSGFIQNLSGAIVTLGGLVSSGSTGTYIGSSSTPFASGFFTSLQPSGVGSSSVIGTTTTPFVSGYISNLSGAAGAFSSSLTAGGNNVITTSSIVGSSNYVAFFTGTNAISGQSNFYYDSSAHKLGLNVVPTQLLTLSGGGIYFDGSSNAASLSGALGELFIGINTSGVAGGWARGIGFNGSGGQNLVFGGYGSVGGNVLYGYIGPTYSAPWITFSSNGAVGIGTSGSTYRLNFAQATSNTSGIGFYNDVEIYRNGTSGLSINAGNGITFTGNVLASAAGKSLGSSTTYWSSGFISNLSGSSISGATGAFSTSLTVGGNNVLSTASMTGSTGQITFFNSSTTLSGSDNLFFDRTSGYLGVRTNTPASPISVVGDSGTDSAQLGAELIPTTGWVSVGWTGSSTGWVHTQGNTSVLSQSFAPTIGNKYQAVITITGTTSGSVSISFGGATVGGITSTYNYGPTAVTSGGLQITPTSDFNGTVSVSIKQITGVSNAIQRFYSSDGGDRLAIRIGKATGNTFVGVSGGAYNTSGTDNAAFGYKALSLNTTGVGNAAFGHGALQSNDLGTYNTAVGNSAGSLITTGAGNTTMGSYSLATVTTGSDNTAIGYAALIAITTSYNTAIGFNAGRNIAGDVAANSISSNSVYLGASTKAGADGNSNEIVIGYNATGSGSNSVVLGSTGIATTYLRGAVGINLSSAPTHTLELPVATSSSSGISLGNDVLLYRSGTSGLQISATSGADFSGRVTASGASNATGINIYQSSTPVGYLLNTDSTTGNYAPGLFWIAPANNSKPKAGIWTQLTTSGSNIFLGTSNSYATGITSLGLIMDAAGRIGLNGNATPTHVLEFAAGTAASSGLAFGTDVEIYRNATSGLYINANGGTTISGNVGIATAPTATRLTITDAGTTAAALLFLHVDDSNVQGLRLFNDTFSTSSTVLSISADNSGHGAINTNYNLYFNTQNALRATITSGGQVIIGNTTVPVSVNNVLLDVRGGIALSSGNSNDVLSLAATTGSSNGTLYWGTYPIVTSGNIASYGVRSWTGTNGVSGNATQGNITAAINPGYAVSWTTKQTFTSGLSFNGFASITTGTLLYADASKDAASVTLGTGLQLVGATLSVTGMALSGSVNTLNQVVTSGNIAYTTGIKMGNQPIQWFGNSSATGTNTAYVSGDGSSYFLKTKIGPQVTTGSEVASGLVQDHGIEWEQAIVWQGTGEESATSGYAWTLDFLVIDSNASGSDVHESSLQVWSDGKRLTRDGVVIIGRDTTLATSTGTSGTVDYVVDTNTSVTPNRTRIKFNSGSVPQVGDVVTARYRR